MSVQVPRKSPQSPRHLTADSFLARPKTELESQVWLYASELARGALMEYGNVLSPTHRKAVQGLADIFTCVCFGGVVGRYAVAMPTGAGKTVSAAMFIVALHRLDRPESVAVCCEKVAQLIQFRNELLRWGVPEEKIGLWYAEDYRMPDGLRPSVQRTLEPGSRQFLLLTHSRTRGKTTLDRMNTYKLTARDLWIYDESLLVSQHSAFDFHPLLSAVPWLESAASIYRVRAKYPSVDRDRRTRLLSLADYLKTKALPLLTTELRRQTENEDAPRLLHLPDVPEQQLEQWRADLRPLYGRDKAGRGMVTLIQKLLKMHGQPIRVVALGESALVTFAIVVPQQLQRLVVLDASFPVRVLENMDKGIKHVTGFEDLKDWSNVSLTIEKGSSGRKPVSEDFPEHAAWAIEKIKQYPSTDPVLVLTFKDRPETEEVEESERRQYRKQETRMQAGLTRAMQDAGLENPERVQFLTFGNETSLSDYKHIPHVIFLGVLHRSESDLIGAFLGQAQALKRPLRPQDVLDSRLGEQAHNIYQGLSRGTCRTIINGKAQPMTVDLRYADPHALWNALKTVMRGCVPVLPASAPKRSRGADAEAILRALLACQQRGETNISIKALKDAAGLDQTTPKDFSRSVTHGLTLQGSPTLDFASQQVGGWFRRRRSLVQM